MEKKNDRHSELSKSSTEGAVGTSEHNRSFGNWNKFRMTNFYGFTLVELIVVITILVILGTIAFVSLGGFTGSARDSVRISDLTNISKGLELVIVKNGTLPPPEAGTNAGVMGLLASGSIIGYQWGVGPNLLSFIKMGWDGKDPLDKKSYTYVVNSNNTKYQILWLAEDAGSVTASLDSNGSILNRAYAWYETRYPILRGSSLGVLLGNSGTTVNQPIQENYSPSTLTGVEIFTATGGLYKAMLSSKSSLSGTWPVLWEIVGRLDASVGTYPGCDTPNIKLPNGQVWAACNVGATTSVGFDAIPVQNPSPTTDGNLPPNRIANVQGNYYQWGRNDNVTSGVWAGAGVTYTGTLTSPGNTTGNTTFYGGDGSGDWKWWGATNPVGGWNIANGGDGQGPCASGYHVPTTGTGAPASTTNWRLAAQAIVGTDSPNGVQFDIIRSTLKLPLTGDRYWSNGQYYNQGAHGYYWSSSSITADSYAVDFSPRGGIIADPNRRGDGFSVRCIKN